MRLNSRPKVQHLHHVEVVHGRGQDFHTTSRSGQ
jgi:hypothetical protein